MTAGPEIRTLAFVDPLDEVSAATDGVVRDLLPRHGGLEIEKSDRFLFLFRRPVDAVTFCLECHEALQDPPVHLRAAVHLGEVRLRENPPEHVERGAKPLELEGPARHTAARVLSLATAGQTLLTRTAFELARRALVGESSAETEGDLTWLAHGDYRFHGPDEIVEVFEVGIPGIAPLTPPKAREEVRRTSALSEEGDVWRPATGREVPGRNHWLLEERLGEDTGLEVWRSRHAKTGETRRTYLGRTDADRALLKRRVEVFSVLHRALGPRNELPRLLEWSLEEPPYVVEIRWTDDPTLETWAPAAGELARVPRTERLLLAARLAEVVAAVHGAGVTVGELSVREIRVGSGPEGGFRPGLATGSEFRRQAEPDDLAAAKDVRRLGIWTYRLAAGDLSLPWAPFWERDVEDELVREDVVAATDRDPERRITAEELARRLRAVDDRRAEREQERRRLERERIRRIRLQRLGIVALALLTLLAVGWALGT